MKHSDRVAVYLTSMERFICQVEQSPIMNASTAVEECGILRRIKILQYLK